MIRRIRAQDTYPIRHKMLRPKGTLNDCIFPKDDDDLTFHLGSFHEHKLVTVASFYFEAHPEFISMSENQYRLRGMATLPDFQKQGRSFDLLKTALPIIQQNQCSLLWCHARESAEGFYQKVGFVGQGELFDIPEIGLHRLMWIQI